MNGTGTASWSGTWHEGEGAFSTASPVISEQPYTYESRFGENPTAGPEELLGAAHAACFNQALAHNLDRVGLVANNIETTVRIDYGLADNGNPEIRGSDIHVTASIRGGDDAQLQAAAAKAAHGCTISKVLTVPVTFTAILTR